MTRSGRSVARVRVSRLLTIPAAMLASMLVTTAPASASGGALIQLVAVGAQNLYLTDFMAQFEDGLGGTGDGKMALHEIVPASFSGITDTSTEIFYSTIVNVPETSATTCAACPDGEHWQFGGASSGPEGVLVVPASSFTYATQPLAVPEPSSLLLAALVLTAFRMRRERSRRR